MVTLVLTEVTIEPPVGAWTWLSLICVAALADTTVESAVDVT